MLCRESPRDAGHFGAHRGSLGSEDGLRRLHQRHNRTADGHPGDGGEGRCASRPGIAPLARQVGSHTAKAWRFVGEMHEIAATFRGAGLPGGFHEAAAEVYERLEAFKDHPEPPAIESVLEVLLKGE